MLRDTILILQKIENHKTTKFMYKLHEVEWNSYNFKHIALPKTLSKYRKA